jgi:hypothetical protein
VGTGPGLAYVPGTNFRISNSWYQVVLTGQETTMAAGDHLSIRQNVEGPNLRELIGDVHSISLMVASSVAPLSFSVSLQNSTGANYSLSKLCTITTANTWQLITLPNLPIWAGGGTWPITSGNAAYIITICLACGSSFMPSANDTWQSGLFLGAVGQSNFCAQPINTVFYVAFVQHEPGSQCSTLMDVPFSQNYDQCLRYFSRSYPYGTPVGGAGSNSFSLFNSVQAVSGACSFAGGIKFPRQMAKTPICTVYAQNTGAANNAYVVYATSGTVPNLGGNNAISSVLATPSGIATLTGSMTSTSPVTAYADWTADTGW